MADARARTLALPSWGGGADSRCARRQPSAPGPPRRRGLPRSSSPSPGRPLAALRPRDHGPLEQRRARATSTASGGAPMA
eukprot:11375643-Alexandrium_andersonii.AAC.1